jgi:NAD(P)-dependent dehydrogenase (short-subunit alcohol dehydrogenase family)
LAGAGELAEESKDMSDMRFDGRVVIVTGAGGNYPSLGRVYATYFAGLGAKVVVNDLGVGPDGKGIQRAHADEVVKEIVEAGGEAVANTNSVAEEASAAAIVQKAIDTWGRVDALVNNAGVCPMAFFDEFTSEDVRKVIDTHLMGNIWMCRAVWPHMKEAGYGRIVNITSGALWGGRYLALYGSGKAGITGLTYTLAIEGEPYGIKVNTLGPAAGTTAVTHLNEESDWFEMMFENFRAEQVAPAVAYLAHEDCAVSAKYFETAGGRVWQRYLTETKGYTKPDLTIEDVRDHLEEIMDREGAEALADPIEIANSPLMAFTPKPYVRA